MKISCIPYIQCIQPGASLKKRYQTVGSLLPSTAVGIQTLEIDLDGLDVPAVVHGDILQELLESIVGI